MGVRLESQLPWPIQVSPHSSQHPPLPCSALRPGWAPAVSRFRVMAGDPSSPNPAPVNKQLSAPPLPDKKHS